MNFLTTSVLLLAFASIGYAKRKAQGKVKYELNWVGGFKSCDKFKNEKIDLTNLVVGKDSPSSTSLGGAFEFTSEIKKDTELVIKIDKETAQGKIMAYTLEISDICDHINEMGMPWTTFVDAMNLEKRECPLPGNTFKVEAVKLDMSSLGDALNRETVGEYYATMELRQKNGELDVIEHDISCHQIGFTVDEIREQSSE